MPSLLCVVLWECPSEWSRTFYKTIPWVSCRLLPILLSAQHWTLQITVTPPDHTPGNKTQGASFDLKTSTCHPATSFICVKQHASSSRDQCRAHCSWTLLQLIIKMNLIVKRTDTPFTRFMQRINFYTCNLAFCCESVISFSSCSNVVFSAMQWFKMVF